MRVADAFFHPIPWDTTWRTVTDGKVNYSATSEHGKLTYDEYLEAEAPQRFSVLMTSLRDVVRANSGFEMTAATAEIGRADLYRMLSEDGNPRFGSLVVLPDQLGFKLCLAVA